MTIIINIIGLLLVLVKYRQYYLMHTLIAQSKTIALYPLFNSYNTQSEIFQDSYSLFRILVR